MHRSRIVIMAVALVGACDKDEGAAKAGGDVKAAAVAESKPGASKAEPAAKDEPAAKVEPAEDEAKVEAPAADGAFGVPACDDYVVKVEACTTFDRSSKAYTMITEAWRKGIAAGESDAVAEKCAKAAELFKCPAK
jgi:hypothetical protein